jgi:uncharacterized protein
MMTTDAQEIADAYVAVFNEPDEGKRAAAVKRLWTPNGEHLGGFVAKGHPALIEGVSAAHVNNVIGHGIRFSARPGAGLNRDALYFAWDGTTADGTVLGSAVQIAILADDGRIAADYSFITENKLVPGASLKDKRLSNKASLQYIFDEMAEGNHLPFVELMHDDLIWKWTGTSTMSGEARGKEHIMKELLPKMSAHLTGTHRIVGNRFIGDDNVIAVEGYADSATVRGGHYHNEVCWIFEFDNGKIIKIVEYSDTRHVDEVFSHSG